jgi:hypothetical protein
MHTFIVLDDSIYIEHTNCLENTDTGKYLSRDLFYLCAWSLSHTQIRVTSPHQDLLLDTLNVVQPLATKRERVEALKQTILHAPGEITLQSSHKLW